MDSRDGNMSQRSITTDHSESYLCDDNDNELDKQIKAQSLNKTLAQGADTAAEQSASAAEHVDNYMETEYSQYIGHIQ